MIRRAQCMTFLRSILTCFHEVALRFVGGVEKDLLSDGLEESYVVLEQGHAGSVHAVVPIVSVLDPVIDEESKDVGGEVEGEKNEVNPVVVVE